jgi:hypothetical protein
MARKPLRSQLNQIRAWVRQGRTDAWIAHQLDIPTSELREFRRRHELAPEAEGGEVELRDEIEAEIEATLGDDELEDVEEDEDVAEEPDDGHGEDEGEREPEDEGDRAPADESSGGDGDEAPAGGRRRRRRRRRSGPPRAGAAMQGTFDHGKDEGFGLWLDPAVEDDPVYTEHWAGHRPVEVTIEPDRIVIKRS